ncbi:MAG: hypothetical protein HQL70_02045, partial [Magnetococcales bacterium]|nr:hypothetical protein [Magnetococcales bacterium]
TPVIDGATSGAVKEDIIQTVNGSLTVTDADSGQNGFVSETITSSHGSLTIDSAGEWSYQLDNSTAQSMYEGEVVTDVIEVTTLDGTTQAINISITGTIDSPSLSVVGRASGEEDSAIALDISAALTDTGGSEALSITIGNVPSGATLSAGTENPDNSWTLTTDDLEGLTITPDDDSDEDFTLSVTATYNEGGETATTTSSIDVSVESNNHGETIYGSGGKDHLRGGDGDDTIYGGRGNDHLDGKDGGDVLDGGAGNDKIHGHDGDDTIYGGDGNDRIDGHDDNDTIYGNNGNDHIHGGDGNDTIFGNDGNDKIEAGKGNDFVDGGAGNDKLELKGDIDDYLISANADGSYTITDIDGDEGTDIISNVETLSYKGGNIDIQDAVNQEVIDPIALDNDIATAEDTENVLVDTGLEIEAGADATADILSAFTEGDGIQVQVTQQALLQEEQSGLVDETTSLSDSINSSNSNHTSDGGVMDAFMSGSGIIVEVQEDSSQQFDNDDADATVMNSDGEINENVNINDFYVSGGNTEDDDAPDADDTNWVATDDAGADIELDHDVDPAVF